ncbi:nitrate reductase [Sesbania bispinosa]|nr:nitrate reductase [Sesbania bispinosa]
MKEDSRIQFDVSLLGFQNGKGGVPWKTKGQPGERMTDGDHCGQGAGSLTMGHG